MRGRGAPGDSSLGVKATLVGLTCPDSRILHPWYGERPRSGQGIPHSCGQDAASGQSGHRAGWSEMLHESTISALLLPRALLNLKAELLWRDSFRAAGNCQPWAARAQSQHARRSCSTPVTQDRCAAAARSDRVRGRGIRGRHPSGDGCRPVTEPYRGTVARLLRSRRCRPVPLLQKH